MEAVEIDTIPVVPEKLLRTECKGGALNVKTVFSKSDCPILEQKQEVNFPIFQKQSYKTIRSLASRVLPRAVL